MGIKDVFALRLFSRVARLGSFSAAARECGLSQSQASRIVADLEADVGAKLLARTTRAVVPTESGSQFLAHVEPILIALEEAEFSVREGGELTGQVRISMPTSVGVREIIPMLAGFSAQHPRLHIQFLLEDRRQDLVREAVDVAIRLGRQADSNATIKLIAEVPRVVVAAPSYLATFGRPNVPMDLVTHRIVSGPASVVPNGWIFSREGERIAVDVLPNFSTNENEGAVAATAAGLGITSTSEWACRRELADGSLERLLTGWSTINIPVYAVFPMGQATRAAGRAMIDHLVECIHIESGGPMRPAVDAH